jgi:surface carbohydrate biosynthesis protein
MKKGVIFLKSVNPGEVYLQSKIIKLGHKIVSLDAEGLNLNNGKYGVLERYSEESIKLSDKLYFWGHEQYSRVEREFPIIKDKGIVSGSPTVDYWKLLKHNDCNSISTNNNKTILIATSFPWANHISGKDYALSAAKIAGNIDCDDFLSKKLLNRDMQEFSLPLYVELVKNISTLIQNIQIILRPHPTESREMWSDLFSKYDNVEIEYTGSISKSLLKCDAFVHFNSTSAFEASLYGKPIFTLVAFKDETLLSRLNKQVLDLSIVCQSVDDIVSELKKTLINGSNSSGKKAESINNVISNMNFNDYFESSSKIMKEINLFDECQPISLKKIKIFTGVCVILHKSTYKLKRRIVWMLAILQNRFSIFGKKYIRSKDYYKYGKSKQGEFSMDTIEPYIENIKTISKFKKVRYILKKGLIVIHEV